MSVLDPKTYDVYRTIILNGKKRKVKFSSFRHPDISTQWLISFYDNSSGIWIFVNCCKSVQECDKYIKQREIMNKESFRKN